MVDFTVDCLRIVIFLELICFCLCQGNDVQFVSKPTLRRTHNETIVTGCQFTTANIESTVSSGFIIYNGTLHYVGSTLSFENDNGLLSFPEWKFPYRISSGDFWCVVQVGFPVVLEEFVSNSSVLFKEPGKNDIFQHFARSIRVKNSEDIIFR